MVLYEYPFNEGIRTMLRLEHLFGRLGTLARRTEPVDHHFALATIFEIMEVAARADLKSDLLKELERHKAQFQGYRGNPHVSEAALDEVVGRIDQAFSALHNLAGKAGQTLASNDWLTGVRSRISIPGGTSSFDLPAYHRWQNKPAAERRADLHQWIQCLQPLADSLGLLLSLVRDTGSPQKVAAMGGQFQQALPAGRPYQLLRLRIDAESGLVPEISANRLMVSVRLLRPNEAGGLQVTTENAAFELTLCA